MEKSSNKIVVYTDGGSRGNPGPAAIGVVIKDVTGHLIKNYGETIGETTNNEAEYRAVTFALAKIKALFGKKKASKMQIDVFMDSELVVRQLRGEYRLEEERLASLFIKVWNLKIDFAGVKFNHVPREQNREADRLVNEALDKKVGGLF